MAAGLRRKHHHDQRPCEGYRGADCANRPTVGLKLRVRESLEFCARDFARTDRGRRDGQQAVATIRVGN